jgi:hypothetical protein
MMKNYNKIKLLLAMMVAFSYNHSFAQCEYTSVIMDNEPISAPTVGFNALGHTQVYVLVDALTGAIVSNNTTGAFAGPFVAGASFQVHAINYDNSNTAPALTAGSLISTYLGVACQDISYVCFEVRTRKQLCANVPLDVVSTSITGQNAAYTLLYVLVDATGTILSSNNTGNFGARAAGEYCIHALSYDALLPPAPLAVDGSLANGIGAVTAGCSNAKTNFLNDKVCFKVNAPTVLTNVTESICAVSTVVDLTTQYAALGVPAVGGTSVWEDAAAVVVADPTSADASDSPFTLTYTNASGCESTATLDITVNAPTVLTNVTESICAVSTVVDLTEQYAALGVPAVGGTSVWEDAAAVVVADPTNADASNSPFTLTYTNAAGCESTATLDITVNAPTALNNINESICAASTVVDLTTQYAALGVPAVSGTSVWEDAAAVVVADPTNADAIGSPFTLTYTNAAECESTATLDITVNAPTVLTDVTESICAASTVVDLTEQYAALGVPAVGGTSVWEDAAAVIVTDPTNADASDSPFTLTYTNAAGCESTATLDITVNSTPNITLPSQANVCANASMITFSGASPAGGTYTIDGTNTNQFTPDATSVGVHTVVYNYTDATSTCTNSATISFNVIALPTVSITPISDKCATDLPFNLTGASPAGGVYSVDGSASTSYDPSFTNVGSHNVVYNYIDATTGCSNSTSDVFVVNAQPTVTLAPPSSLCANDAAITLNGGTPAAGTYTVDGVVTATFDPAPTNVGNHTMVYLYTDAATGCSNSANNSFFVNAQPNVMMLPISNQCETGSAFTLTGGMPGGGSYSVDGIAATIFDPSPANSGPHTITYNYTDAGTSCSNSTSTTFNVTACDFTFSIADPCICMNNADDNLGTLGQFSENFTINGGVGPYLVQVYVPGTTTLINNGVFDYALSNIVNDDANNQQYSASPSGVTNIPIKFFGGVGFDVVITDLASGLSKSILNSGGCAYPSINAGADIAACAGTSTIINATMSNVDNFSWNTGQVSEDISVTAGLAGTSTTYTLTGTTTDGCTVSDEVMLTSTSLPSASISGADNICIGAVAPITITGTPGITVTVSNGSATVATVAIPASGTTNVSLGGGNYTIASVSAATCTGSGTGSASITTFDCLALGDIGGTSAHIWNDTNNDGVYSPTEPPLVGVVVNVYNAGPDGLAGTSDDVFVIIGLSDAAGNFIFSDLPVYNTNGDLISYYLAFPPSVTIGAQNANLTTSNVGGSGVNDPNDSDPFIGSSITNAFTLLPNATFINAGAGYYVLVAAAVELISMSAVANCEGVTLEWVVAHEDNTDYYITQRSNNAQTWQEVKRSDAVGVSGGFYTYKITDNYLALSETYYRILEVENGGLENVLPIRSVKTQCENELGLVVYPNPVIDVLTYEVVSPLDTRFTIQILDMLGRVLFEKDIVALEGKSSFTVNVDNLAAGAYITGIKNENTTKYQMVQKVVR